MIVQLTTIPVDQQPPVRLNHQKAQHTLVHLKHRIHLAAATHEKWQAKRIRDAPRMLDLILAALERTCHRKAWDGLPAHRNPYQ
jgi:hypothetical protein